MAGMSVYSGIYWGHIGIMEKKMETAIGSRRVIYWYLGVILGQWKREWKLLLRVAFIIFLHLRWHLYGG